MNGTNNGLFKDSNVEKRMIIDLKQHTQIQYRCVVNMNWF